MSAPITIPLGFALVPKRMTRAIEQVITGDTQDDSWQWADVLQAAEAISDDEHESIMRYDSLAAIEALEEKAGAAAVTTGRVTLDLKQASDLLSLFAGEPTEITLLAGTGHSGEGLYAVFNADPDGAVYLGQTDEEAMPEAATATDASSEGLPPMPPVHDRRNYRDEQPHLGLESDNDWCDNNLAGLRWFIDHHKSIRKAIAAPAPTSGLSATLKALGDEHEAKRQAETNQFLERIHLGMRDGYHHAARLAGVPTAEPVEWGSPETVGMFLRQLQTVDPALPIHGVIHVDIDGKRTPLTKPLIFSRERIKGRRIHQGDESVPYSIAVWTGEYVPPAIAQSPADEVARIVHLRTDRARRVYIAGPMTGLPGYNFDAFNAKAAELRAEGWHVENPAEHGHIDGAGWADYLRWDISRIATCGSIFLLPGWSASKGATLEVLIGKALGVQFLGGPLTEAAPVAIDYDGVYNIVRGTGYVTRGQADEITALILAAAAPAPVLANKAATS